MKLIDYMRDEKLDDERMAEMIGGCTAHAVKKWKYGERTPDAARMLKIEEITNNRVSLRDWGQVERAAS